MPDLSLEDAIYWQIRRGEYRIYYIAKAADVTLMEVCGKIDLLVLLGKIKERPVGRRMEYEVVEEEVA